MAIGASAFGANEGKINFSWYVPTDIFWDWQLDDYKTFPVVEDTESAVKSINDESNKVFYNAGVLSMEGLDGYKVSVVSVDGRSISNFVVEGNNCETSLVLNKGIYLINANKGSQRIAGKFIVK